MLKKSTWLILSSRFDTIQLRYSELTHWYVLVFWMKNPGETWLKASKGEDQRMAQFWLVSATSLNNKVHN